MKTLMMFAFLLVSLSFIASGQELETYVDSNAGTTPDSVVWGIDRAIEKIEIILTLGSAEKENKRLEHAHERLLEIRKMLEEGKIKDAEKARNKHEEILNVSKRKIAKLDDSDLVDVASLEDLVEAQELEIEDLDIHIGIRGSLNESQKLLLQEFINSLGRSLDNVRIVIRDKENEALNRIEKRTGISKIELIDELGRLREKKIVRAEVFDGFSVVKVGYRFTTRTTEREALIGEIVERFPVSERDVAGLLKIESADSNESDSNRLRIRIKIREEDGLSIAEVEVILRKRTNSTSEEDLQSTVVDFTHLTRENVIDVLIVHREKEKDRENRNESDNEREIEIESKTRDLEIVTRVKIEWDGVEKEVILHTQDLDVIVERLANLLDASPQEIRDAITKFENGDLKYVARGDNCDLVKYFCAEGMESFRNDIGCGCKEISDDSKDDEFERD